MLYFVRHGQTDWNKEWRLQGNADIPLNDEGKKQALAANEALKDVKFDKVFCSPLRRAVETCGIITDNAPSVQDERLTERFFGSYEGAYASEIDFEGMWTESRENEFDGVEKLAALKERVFSFLDGLTAEYHGKNVLVVAHGGIAFLFFMYFNGAPADGSYRFRLLENGEYTTFEL
jgi:broad specificity phosphatase PhoE